MIIGNNHFSEDDKNQAQLIPKWAAITPFSIGVLALFLFMITFQWQLSILAVVFIISAAISWAYIMMGRKLVKPPQTASIVFLGIGCFCAFISFSYMPGSGPSASSDRVSDGFALILLTTGVTVLFVPISVHWALTSAMVPDSAEIEQTRVRGASMSKRAAFLKLFSEREDPKHIPVMLGSLPMPKEVERLHTLIAASTGSGKSQTLMHLLKSIRERGDRAVILDNGGEMGRRFARPDDLSVDPFSMSGQGWRLASEARHRVDWERLAAAFVPEGSGNSKEWHSMAKAMFAAVGGSLWEIYGSELTNSELQRALVAHSPRELQPLVQGTSVEALATDDERAASRLQSVRMSFIDNLKSWQYIPDGNFSFRDWVARQDNSWLFVPYRDFNLPITRQLISAWMDILVSSALEAGENRTGRMTWIIIDELDALGEIPVLLTGVARLRKTGLSIVGVIQNVSQLRSTYTENKADTLMNNLSNKVILRMTTPDEAEAMSKVLGEVEVMERKESYSTERAGVTISHDLKTRSLVMPAEIMSLPPLHGFVKFAGDWPVVPVVVPIFEEDATQAAE